MQGWFGLPLVVPIALRSLYYITSVGWLLLLDSVVGGLALAALTNLVSATLCLSWLAGIHHMKAVAHFSAFNVNDLI